MTERDDILQELERLNPIPDHEAIYADGEEATRLRTAVDAKRAPKVAPARAPRWNRRNLMVASLAFAAVVVFGAVAMLVFDGGEPEEVALVSTTAATTPTSSPILTTTAAPDPTEPPQTTTVAPETATTGPSTTTTETPATTAVPVPDQSFLSEPATGPFVGPIMGDGPHGCDNDDEISFYEGPPVILRPSQLYDGGIGPFFCLAGFDPGRAVVVTVTHPSGLARTTQVQPGIDVAGGGVLDGKFHFVWRSLPGDPLGQYSMTARQGGSSASLTFEVVAPQSPGISIEPVAAPAGSVVDIVLFGMEPDAVIGLNIYRQQQPWREVGGLVNLDPIGQVTVTTDGDGWAVLSIDTGVDDPAVGYLVDPAVSPPLFTGCVCPYALGVFELLPP